ncbi:MAG: hypothetical protein M1829_002277 [Trizodia sp. TS-e1964]|nr:MAG: hypothetical protein M1829_002277 [Trizodia sp. TS-e1964]
MVKFFESSFSYDYTFPAVTLAYFLRYPNPYSTHVLSTDVIERRVDPATNRLHTTRLHLKRSKVPSGILKLLPKGFLGSSGDAGQSYILEKSIVDVREGWMETESRNLEWTGILSVKERQIFRKPTASGMTERGFDLDSHNDSDDHNYTKPAHNNYTAVTTIVAFHSRIGQGRFLHRRASSEDQGFNTESDEQAPKRPGFFQSWSTAGIQRSIEIIGVRRTRETLHNGTEGMKLVLERLRQGGLGGVLEGIRRDRELSQKQQS